MAVVGAAAQILTLMPMMTRVVALCWKIVFDVTLEQAVGNAISNNLMERGDNVTLCTARALDSVQFTLAKRPRQQEPLVA